MTEEMLNDKRKHEAETWAEHVLNLNKKIVDKLMEDDFKIELINPVSREMEVARYNRDHPEQHTTIKYMSIEEVLKQYPSTDVPKVEFVTGIDPYRNFEQFWLETNDYYGIVDETDLPILKEVHPLFASYSEAKKKVLGPGEFEPFAEFGIGDEYNGMLLADWLKEKNMLHFFNELIVK